MRTNKRYSADGSPPPYGRFFHMRSLAAVCAILTLALTPIENCGWQPAVAAEPAKRAPASHPSLIQAKRLIDAGQAEEAVTSLRRFLGTDPKPDLLDDTYLLLGAALYRAQQYGEALK